MQKQIQTKGLPTTWDHSHPQGFWNKCSPALQRATWRTHKIVEQKAVPVVEAAHLMLGLLDEVEATPSKDDDDTKLVKALLTRLGVNCHELRIYTEAFLEDDSAPPPSSTTQASSQSQRVFEYAWSEALGSNGYQVGLEHLLLALLTPQPAPYLAQALEPLGLTLNNARFHLRKLQHTAKPARKGNPLDHLSEGGKHVVAAAHTAMRTSYCGRISTLHLLLGVLAQEESLAVATFEHCGMDVEELKHATRQAIKHDGQVATPQHKFTAGAKRALERARAETLRLEHRFVSTEYLLLGLLPRTMSPKERLYFGDEAEEDVTRVFSTADCELLRQNLLEALGGNYVGTSRQIPKSSKHRRWIIYAFVLPFGWATASTLLASINSKEEGRIILAANSILLAYSVLNLLGFIIFSRSQLAREISYSVFLGFMVGVLATLYMITLFP